LTKLVVHKPQVLCRPTRNVWF